MKVGAYDLSIGSVWSPWPSADRPLCKDAASSREEALKSTLAAWSHCTRRPLIEVAGGLDSAIVAAGMALAAEGASLISFASAPGDPDETLYAQALAQHLGLELEIAHPRVEDVDLTRSPGPALPRTTSRAFVQAPARQTFRQARAIAATRHDD